MLDGFVVLGMLFCVLHYMISLKGYPWCLYDHIVHTSDYVIIEQPFCYDFFGRFFQSISDNLKVLQWSISLILLQKLR